MSSAARPSWAASAASVPATRAWMRRSSPAMAGASRSTMVATVLFAASRMAGAAARGAATASVTITKSPGVFRTMASCIRRYVGAEVRSAPIGASGSSPMARDTARATSSALRPSLALMAASAASVACWPRTMPSRRTICSATRLVSRASACGVREAAAAMSAAALITRESTLSAKRIRFWVGDRMGAYFPRNVPSRWDVLAAAPGPTGMAISARVPAHQAASSSPNTRA